MSKMLSPNVMMTAAPVPKASNFMSSLKDSLKGSQPIYSVSSMSSKRLKIADEGIWSGEMDIHLWTTFDKYPDDASHDLYRGSKRRNAELDKLSERKGDTILHR